MEWAVLDKIGRNIAVFRQLNVSSSSIFAMDFSGKKFKYDFLIFNLIINKNDFYEEPIKSFSDLFHQSVRMCSAYDGTTKDRYRKSSGRFE